MIVINIFIVVFNLVMAYIHIKFPITSKKMAWMFIHLLLASIAGFFILTDLKIV